MALKKYSDFTGTSGTKNTTSPIEPKIVEEVKTIVKPVVKPVEKVVEKNEIPLVFNGHVVKFPNDFKPSNAYSLLESKSISKDKLHYMVIEQSNESLLVVKYNEKVDLKLKEFVDNLISYYRKNPQLDKIFGDIVVEGNDTFSIIKNIPKVDLNGKTLISILNNDLMNLLKSM